MTLDEAIIWKQIEDFPNYSVSSDGQIRNDKTGKLRVLSLDHNGYVVCGLSRSGKRKECKVHRLVAYAFIDNPNNKPHINHKNGIVTDNTVNNLEWCTQQENTYHAWNILDSSERRKKMAGLLRQDETESVPDVCMTNEEAIKILKSKMDGSVDPSYEFGEAVRMAIRALSNDGGDNEVETLETNERFDRLHLGYVDGYRDGYADGHKDGYEEGNKKR